MVSAVTRGTCGQQPSPVFVPLPLLHHQMKIVWARINKEPVHRREVLGAERTERLKIRQGLMP